MSDRDAQERTRIAALQRGLGGARVCHGAVSRQGDEGVQHGVELLDPSQQRTRHFDGREFPLPIALPEFTDGGIGDRVTHDASLVPV